MPCLTWPRRQLYLIPPLTMHSVEYQAQQDFDFNLEKPDWVALRLLLNGLEEELADRRKHLLRKISDWFLALKLFARFEEIHLVRAEPTDRDREFYRVFLTQLMAQGEKLALDLERAHEVDPQAIGLRAEDVSANLRHLRDKYARLAFEVSPERREAILNLFREPVSAT